MKIRLSTRLVISVLLIEAIMLSALVWNSVRLIGSSHAEVLTHHIDEEAVLLSNVLAPGLAVGDRAILLDSLSLVGKEESIIYAVVTDMEGNVMASIGNVPENSMPDSSFEGARLSGIYDVVKNIELFGQNLGALELGYSTKYVDELIHQTRLQNTLIAAVELVLSLIMTLIVGYFLTRSLRRLEEGATALARDDLDHRIELDTQDEMGDLARSFNNLATHLSATRTSLKEEHDALGIQTRRMQTLLDGIDAVIVEADPLSFNFIYVSREAENLLGFSVEDWMQPEFLNHNMHPEDREYFEQQRDQHCHTQGSFSSDFRMVHKDGNIVDIRAMTTIDKDDSGELTCRSLILDVTEQKLNEERIVYLAEHDVLTGLYNRRRFQTELERELDLAERFNQKGALLFIDLDQFKYINDTLGHQAGDEFLCTIANRLSGSLRKVDIIGRLGGDEFGIILTETDLIQAEHVAAHLLERLRAENDGFDDLETPVSASIGIVIFPDHGNIPGNLLAKADAAMYSAKENGRNMFHVYSDNDQKIKSMHAKLEWEHRIRDALENDLFELNFQPIFWLESRTVPHYEVLLRMRDSDGGLIPPGAFLDIAERFGMIRDIDNWVLEHAIKIQGESCRNGKPVSLAINLSGKHFGNPEVLESIKRFIKESEADPSMLIFEITETAAVGNIYQANRFTEALHSLGCRIALDDFGVGFSSFHYLKHLPVDMVKLDGSFVRHVAKSKFDRVFIKSMTDMARGLGITSVAEFIETEDVVDILKELDVDMGQGFHLARPSATFDFPCVTEDKSAIAVDHSIRH
jgi:diguanylate cyclase (GGDEF)-like protein/PAS domain S-box-containing protein